jgi:hypothetical protein
MPPAPQAATCGAALMQATTIASTEFGGVILFLAALPMGRSGRRTGPPLVLRINRCQRCTPRGRNAVDQVLDIQRVNLDVTKFDKMIGAHRRRLAVSYETLTPFTLIDLFQELDLLRSEVRLHG